MTMTQLKQPASEEGTFVINIEFYDQDKDLIVPNSLTWTLTDKEGRVINSRENVVVTSPTSSNDVVLTGNDLAIDQENNRKRVLSAHATWSGSLGVNLPLNGEAGFIIDDLLVVT